MKQEFITHIAKQGAKKPFYTPSKQLLLWFIVMAIYAALIFSTIGLRADFFQKITEPLFVLELIVIFATSFTSGVAASFLALPDVNQKHYMTKVPLIFLFFLCIIIGLEYCMQGLVMPEELCGIKNYQCTLAIIIFAIIPSSIFFVILYRAATIHSGFAGFMIGLCGGSFSYLLLRLIHSTENIAHLLAWHLVPVLLVTVICIVIAKLLANVKQII